MFSCHLPASSCGHHLRPPCPPAFVARRPIHGSLKIHTTAAHVSIAPEVLQAKVKHPCRSHFDSAYLRTHLRLAALLFWAWLVNAHAFGSALALLDLLHVP